MTLPNIELTVTRHYAEPPPYRSLKLDCQVAPSPTFELCILDSWSTVRAKNGRLIAEGKILLFHYARINTATIRVREAGVATFVIPLPGHVLASLEEARAGEDLELSITTSALVSPLRADNPMHLATPQESAISSPGSHDLAYKIPQSEWLKLLRQLQWNELELIELPRPWGPPSKTTQRATARFEDAVDAYRRGNWDDSMASCRKAFEAMVQDLTGTADMAKTEAALISHLGEGPKAKRLNVLIRELGQFLHLARHEVPEDVIITRSDASLSLQLTGAILRYIGQS